VALHCVRDVVLFRLAIPHGKRLIEGAQSLQRREHCRLAQSGLNARVECCYALALKQRPHSFD